MTGPEPEPAGDGAGGVRRRPPLQEFDPPDPDPVYNPGKRRAVSSQRVQLHGEKHRTRLSIGTYNMTQQRVCAQISTSSGSTRPCVATKSAPFCERCSLEPSIFNSRRAGVRGAAARRGDHRGGRPGIGLGVGIVGFSLVFIIAGLGQRCSPPPTAAKAATRARHVGRHAQLAARSQRRGSCPAPTTSTCSASAATASAKTTTPPRARPTISNDVCSISRAT